MNKNQYINKRHLTAVKKFNDELKEFSEYTGKFPPVLYEDPFTSFSLSDISIEDGILKYKYDGYDDYEIIVQGQDGEYWESEYNGIMDNIKFWRACLRRAKRYWKANTEASDDGQNNSFE